MSAQRAGAAVGGDDVPGADPRERILRQVGQHQLDAVGVLEHAQALVLEKNGDVGEAVDAFAQHRVDGGLIDELLRRMAVASVGRKQRGEGTAVRAEEGGARAGLHVGIEPVGEPDLLPDPQHLLVGGDRAGAEVDVGIALDHGHIEAPPAQQVRRGGAHRAISDDGDVIGRRFVHGCLALVAAALRGRIAP